MALKQNAEVARLCVAVSLNRGRGPRPRRRRVLNTMVFAWLLAGCGSYDEGKKDTTGGTSGSTATGGTSGSTATGGASGGGGQAGTGGSGPTGGASGSGGGGAGGSAANGGAPGGSGGSGGSVSCSDVEPCGGTLVGSWTAASCELTVSGMADMAATGLMCPSAPVMGSLRVSGTWTANADGTYMDATTTSGELMLELPQACKMISGTTTTCDRVVLGALGLNTITCVDNTTTMGCTCTATVNQEARPALIAVEHVMSGTFVADGNGVVMTGEGRDTEYSYCVSGNTLTMTLETVGQVGTVTGNIVLQKQ
jgi:hypothetical protein